MTAALLVTALLGALPSTATGRIERLEIASPQLADRRTVQVWLPPGHASSSQRYPVVYLQDAQNVFDVATSFAGHEWQADETAAALAAEGRPTIVVAVPHAGAGRLSEYSPFPWTHGGEHVTGRGDLYVDFLADTLKPAIDARFRTRPGAADTVIAGSSLGGLVSLYAAIRRPDVFGRAAVMSPSLWIADRAMFLWLEGHRARAGQRFWVDVGTGEGETPAGRAEAVEDARRLARVLEEQGAGVRLEVAEGAGHDEGAWAARWPRALRFLLPP